MKKELEFLLQRIAQAYFKKLKEKKTPFISDYNLKPCLYAKCKIKYLSKGVEGLMPAYKQIDLELRALDEENERFKRIVARLALEIEFKSELFKKSPELTKTRR